MKHVGGWGGALGFWDGNDIKFAYDDFLYNYKCNWAIKCYKLKNTILPVKKKECKWIKYTAEETEKTIKQNKAQIRK